MAAVVGGPLLGQALLSQAQCGRRTRRVQRIDDSTIRAWRSDDTAGKLRAHALFAARCHLAHTESRI